MKGDVVVVPFPFSNLAEAKRRPALLVAELERDDRILCQITSRHFKDRYAVGINDADFEEGSLKKDSNVRPNRLFTADSRIILYRAGHLKAERVGEVVESIINILNS